MALADRPGCDELDARPARAELSADGEPAECRVAATVDFELEAELFELVNQAVRPRAAVTPLPEIRIDQSERVPVTGASGNRGVFLASIFGASAASLSLAWVVIGGLASPFDWSSIGKLGAHRAADRDVASPTVASPALPAQSAGASAPVAEAKADRQQLDRLVARETDQRAPPPAHRPAPQPAHQPPPAKSPDNPDLFSSTQMTRWKSSLAATAPVPPANGHATIAQPRPAQPRPASVAKPEPEPRITAPVPETRPTTIEGWTLREIVNGTAVLEGPGGSVRVGRGDTVPGAGKVLAIFRWGNRSMVATSRGLISTP